MAQITEEMVRCIERANGNFPLTAWETLQFARAWHEAQKNKPTALSANLTMQIAAAQFWAIEQSAQQIEQAAEDIVAACIDSPDQETRMEVSSLADAYGMAAKEVRRQIPAFLLMEARNLAAIKAWDKASAPPILEKWESRDHAPGGLDPSASLDATPAAGELPQGEAE